jgi:UDP-N-acetylmuramate dehydrogenase
MTPAAARARLIDRLPPVRGRLTENAPLAPVTWFRVGGPAEILFKPADAEDLAAFIAAKPADVALTVIGVGSNLLVRDGGIPGVVVRLGRSFAGIAREDDALICGAAALDLNVALFARDAGIGGLEFLSGIPGTIGGALRMNAGAYGREIADVLLRAEAIFVAAALRADPGDPAAIQARIAEIRDARESSQPVRARTGGSTFANPTDPRAEGRKAWELIDLAGCRGLRVGGAQVSEKHCNFLINAGDATAEDIERLGEEVRARVARRFGVTLRWEIRRIGLPSKTVSSSGS